MALSDFDKVIRNVQLNDAGKDTVNSRWTDTSGYANHLPFTAGTPTTSTVGGVNAWAPLGDGSVYTEYQAPDGEYSVILPIYHNSANVVYYWWKACRTFANGDHDGTTNTAADWATIDTAYLRLNNATPNWYAAAATMLANGGAITKTQWNIYTFCVDPANSKIKLQINDGTPVIVTGASWNSVRVMVGDRVRLGHLINTGSVPGTFGYHSITEVADDVFANQSSRLATEIASLKTLLSIP